MSLLRKVRVMAAKIETTAGTAISLGAGDAAFNAFDVECTPDVQFFERQGQGAFSQLPGTTGLRGGTFTFKTELFGDGAGGVPGWASSLLPALGMVDATDKFSPSSESPGSNVKTVTIASYENGGVKKLHGAVGNVRIICKTGEPIMLEWEFKGVWNDPANATILAPTYPTITPLRFATATWTIGGATTYKVGEVSFDLGNTLYLRPDPSVEAGYSHGIVTGRRVTGSMDPESILPGTTNFYTLFTDLTEQALVLQVTDGTDTIQIAAPQIQFTNVPPGEREGVQTDSIDFQCNAAAAAGNDEFTIDFSP